MSKKKKRIPKEIGGVKLPKELRRTGEALIDHANSPQGRQAIAAGLTFLAGLAANRGGRSEANHTERPRAPEPPVAPIPPEPPVPPIPPVPPVPPLAAKPGANTPPDMSQMVDAMSSAANAFMSAFLRPKP
jgi:hypothetical protein